MDRILEIHNLRKEFKGFVLDNISFSLPRGFIMGFIGPNGAGKTTTIKLIMNLVHRNSGEIEVFGLDSVRHEKEIKERIGFVYDETYYFELLTAGEIGFLMPRFYRSWDRAAYSRYLTGFEIPAKKKIKEFSRGMKMKFSLAVALSHNAELIILDEPTSGLDPIFRQEILTLLAEAIQDGNKAVLFSSHITSDLERIADYVTFIDQGRIIFSESKEDVLERYSVVQGPKADLNPDLRAHLIGLRNGTFGFEGLCADIEAIRSRLSDPCVVEKASLDQIMFYFVHDGHRSK
jgi:ABC-2 type transport system ATP-binding protein